MNKYEKWYNSIIEKGRISRPWLKTERHHIVPECFFKNRVRKGPAGWLEGNPDDPNNFTYVTGREHFICHWLLIKMNTGIARRKMINAMYMMQAGNDLQERYQTRITSRVYEKLREEYAEYISKLNTGRIQPPDEKARQIAAVTGRTRDPFSEEWKNNLSRNHKSKHPEFNGSLSEETRKKIGDRIRGRKQTEEEKQRRREANLGKTHKKLLCPHCLKLIAVNTYPRWHGSNCRSQA
jgi:hypothetical protein